MTLFQILIGILIISVMVARPFLYKPCVKYFPAELSVTFTSIWLMISLIIAFPIFFEVKYIHQFNTLIPYFALSLSKGILLWSVIKLQQVINKESTSSSVFLGFVAMAMGSLVNNLFFKEGLQIIQLMCICGLGILGLFFISLGDAKRLSFSKKKDFFIVTLLMASFSVIDHLCIPKIGWFLHIVVSSVTLFLVCFSRGISKQDYFNVFRNKQIVLAGIVYCISEFLVIYSSINIMPVSFVTLFMRLAAPIVMIISAIIYQEQSVKNQLSFSLLAFLLALPLIFL